MKRTIVILVMLLSLAVVGVRAQFGIYTDCVNLNDMTGDDSTFYYSVFPSRNNILPGAWAVIVDDEAVISDSLHMTIGTAGNRDGFLELSITNWPYELGTDSVESNGTYTHGRAAYDDIVPFRYLSVKAYKEESGVETVATDSVCWKVLMFK